MLIRFLMALLAATLTLNVAMARQRNVPLYVPEKIILQRIDGQPSTAEQVRKAILTGSQPFGWKLTSDKPGVVHLEYTKSNGIGAVVRVNYDDRGYQINYVSSDGLNYDDQGSDPTIHPTYNMWVKYLVMRIMLPGELMPASAVSPAVMNGNK